MRQHCENARAVVGFLGGHPAVTRVLYPGLEDHPGHEIAARQMRDYGGMISFLVDDERQARDAVAPPRVWALAESLGGVESLMETPAQITPSPTRAAPSATPPTLGGLSVGIESADDLIEDLEQALN